LQTQQKAARRIQPLLERAHSQQVRTCNALQMYDDETPNFCKSGTRENLRSVRFVISSSSPSVVCCSVAREVELRSVKNKIRGRINNKPPFCKKTWIAEKKEEPKM